MTAPRPGESGVASSSLHSGEWRPKPSASQATPGGHGFGPTPVFFAGISTILGAVMFLRFGYGVGHLGLLGAVAMILLGHAITIPTALALSEIATNRRVEGGGEYFIISRSFGLRIGSAIGFALYLSQGISVAFYCIAFGEAFTPIAGAIEDFLGFGFDPRMVSLPTLLALAVIMLTRGADMGVKVLYAVVAVLGVSLVLFFLGDPVAPADGSISWTARISDADGFFIVFAICFPGFTGMTAGVGLSGDLAQPRRAIPIGTIAATLAGLVVYLAIVWKLATHAPAELLAEDQLVMSQIALWGPIIPIGLGAATLSSAIGSLLVAPRTLQAIGRDRALPLGGLNGLLSRGVGASDEPRVATLVTTALAIIVIALGSVDLVARLISMFFMMTYGALCAISFLEHFASNPSYRPRFRTRWYISLFGALACLLMMFLMDPAFAVFALLAMGGLYALSHLSESGRRSDGLAVMVRSAMSQATRHMQLGLQRGELKQTGRHWRPAIITISSTEPRVGDPVLRLLGWMCERYGFGTYVHRVPGRLDITTYDEAQAGRQALIGLVGQSSPGVFAQTMISPSPESALAQAVQMPGISGLENNTVLFGFSGSESCRVMVERAGLALAARKNVLFLRCDDPTYGARQCIHIWLTWHDEDNANLMLLAAYIVLGHGDWRKAELRVFAALPADRIEQARASFIDRIAEGRLPIGEANIEFLTADDGDAYDQVVAERSRRADLVLFGVTAGRLERKGSQLLEKHPEVQNALFVLANEDIQLD